MVILEEKHKVVVVVEAGKLRKVVVVWWKVVVAWWKEGSHKMAVYFEAMALVKESQKVEERMVSLHHKVQCLLNPLA